MGYRKLASWSLRYPKWIIGTWVILFVLSGFYAVKLPSVLKGHGLTTTGSFAQVQEILQTDFQIAKEPIILVFEKKVPVSPVQFHSFIGYTLSRLQGLQGLIGVVSPLDKKGMMEGNWAYAMLFFKQEPSAMGTVIEQIRSRLPDHGNMTVKLTGKSVVQQDVNEVSQADLKKSEIVGIPIALGVLIFAFRGVIAAFIPLLVGWLGVSLAMGIMYWVGTRNELSIFVLNVIPMVGLALSVDFALLLISRFREELKGNAVGQALANTMETAGRSIVFSGACVFLGLAGTWFIDMPIFHTVALGAMVVLLVSVLANLTFLPAVLAILGQRMDSGELGGVESRLWYALSCFVMKRPVRMIVVSTVTLFICVLPLSSMNVVVPDASTLPKKVDSRLADELYKRHFTAYRTSQVMILADAKESAKVYDIIQKLTQDPLVMQVDSIFSRFRLTPEQFDRIMREPKLADRYKSMLGEMVHNGRMLIHVTLRAESASKDAMDWVRGWEQKPEPIPLIIGGEAKYQQEIFDEIFLHLKDVVLFVFLSNFIVLFIAFRSVLIPIKTIFLSLLSLAVSFGILTWIFEQGRFGIEPTGIAIMIPVFIFGLVFGISMDYGVFLVSRIYEIYRKTGDNDFAVLIGLSSTTRMIASAAAIMIAVTGSFATAGVVPMKQLGIGIAVAILIDATIIRMIFVPSLMKLLGAWNWWAPPLMRKRF